MLLSDIGHRIRESSKDSGPESHLVAEHVFRVGKLGTKNQRPERRGL